MSEYLDWKVGDEVVFVGFPKQNSYWRFETLPKLGEIYTIRSIVLINEVACIRLKEIVNEQRMYSTGMGEAAFVAKAFRKMLKRKTDISMFTKMLNKTPAENKKELEVCER